MASRLYLRSDTPGTTLRIGVLLDREACPRCFAAVLEDIRQATFCRLELIVFPRGPKGGAGPRRSLWATLRARLANRALRRGTLYDLYVRWDQRRASADDPLHEVDCTDLLAGVPRIDVEPIAKGFTHRFPPEAIASIRARNLDVILRFGFNILRGDVLRVARYGIWSFHHGDNQYYRGGPAHFWELYEENPVSGVILQVLTEELDAGLVLCKSLFATEAGMSQRRNRYGPYWGSTHCVIRKLHELHRHGWAYLERRALPPAPYEGRRTIYRTPTNAEMTGWLARTLVRKAVVQSWRAARVCHWRVAIRRGAPPLYGKGGAQDPGGFRWVEAPRGHAYADPFLLARDGRVWLFVEDFVYAESRGRIGCAEVGADGTVRPVRPILDRPYHLSYPQVFEHEGEVFMIPESGAAEQVQLFRATRFPEEWTLERVLFEGRAVDTTVWRQAGLWWFFTTLCETPGHAAMHLLFYAPSLAEEWTYHPANPISTDVRNARGAGGIFTEGGRVLRPTQSGVVRYGYSFTVNEITELSRTSYEERAVRTVDPSWSPGLCSTHTYGRCGEWEVIDGGVMARRCEV